MRGRALLAAAAIAASSGVASAQSPGDIVYTTDSDQVFYRPIGGPSQLIHQFADPDVRLGDVAIGPNLNLYVNNGPLPVVDPSTASVFEISNWTGATNVSTLASSDPIQNPIGGIYDPLSNNIIAVNNPGSSFTLPNRFEGLLGVDVTTGVVTEIYAEQSANPLPRYTAGAYIDNDPRTPGDFFVTAVEGSDQPFNSPPNSGANRASTIHRFSISADLNTVTESMIIDLGDTATTGLPDVVGRVTGVAAVDDAIFVTAFSYDTSNGSIYRVDLDGAGQFAGITEILNGNFFPEAMQYNPFTDRLVVADRRVSNSGGRIFQVGLDGLNFAVLETGVLVRGIDVIPAPGTVALLGLGGMLAARRRR